MLPAYLSYGGWGGQAVGEPPETAITILAACSASASTSSRRVGPGGRPRGRLAYLPLKLGLKLGATRLLALSTLYVLVAGRRRLAVAGSNGGLSQ